MSAARKLSVEGHMSAMGDSSALQSATLVLRDLGYRLRSARCAGSWRRTPCKQGSLTDRWEILAGRIQVNLARDKRSIRTSLETRISKAFTVEQLRQELSLGRVRDRQPQRHAQFFWVSIIGSARSSF
jgi:hypothetical protein